MSDSALVGPYAPVLPPGEDELPSSDGEPMDSERHCKQMNLLVDSLASFWHFRDDFYAGGNMFLYFNELQAKKNTFRGPDVFVVLDTIRRERKSWVMWQKERAPDVIIELLSPSTEHVDRGEKMRIYGRVLRVPEYYLYEPGADTLEGYQPNHQLAYAPLAPDKRGQFLSQRLGIRLGVWTEGLYQGIPGPWLRWWDDTGHVLPSDEEAARSAQADARSAQAEAQTAQDQAAALQEKLAAYEKRFGPLLR